MAENSQEQAPVVGHALEVIEAERYRNYSALVRNLHWLSTTLVVLYALLNESIGEESRLALLVLASIMGVYTLAFHYTAAVRLSPALKMRFESWFDLAWITAVIVFSRAAYSPFVFLHYIVIYASTPAEGRTQTYTKAAVASVLALLAGVWADPDAAGLRTADLGLWIEAFRNLLWPLMGLWMVAYFSTEADTLGADLHRSLFVAAHTDDLTGLANMRYFTTVADIRGKLGEPYAIVMVDADYLKELNDTYGHAAGSALILRVSEGLRRAARSRDDVCSRLGGDEFIVRLAGADAAGATSYCERVRAYLVENPLFIEGRTRPVSVSMGIAAFPEHGANLTEVTRRADQALYASKAVGRGCDTVWEPSQKGKVVSLERGKTAAS